jgi:hypothetical protein
LKWSKSTWWWRMSWAICLVQGKMFFATSGKISSMMKKQ